MEKKSNKGLVISLVIFILATIGLGVYLAYDKGLLDFIKPNVKETKKEETKTEAKKEEYNNKDEINLNNLEFNIDKCQNCDSNMNYLIFQSGSFATATLNENRKSVALFLDYNELSKFDPNINKNSNAQQEIAFDQTIEDIVYVEFGQDATYGTLLYLLNDGTVEYTPLLKAAKENNFKSYGKLGNLKDIVKFYKTMSESKSGVGAANTCLAQSKDGSLYDLSSIIESTNNY